MVCPSFIFAKP